MSGTDHSPDWVTESRSTLSRLDCWVADSRLWLRGSGFIIGNAPASLERSFVAWNQSPGSISLVIPAYNEESRLTKSISAYLPVLERLGLPFEIIVVADGSDATPAVAESFAHRNVRCYQYPTKLGRGGAILQGFRLSKYDLVGYADADGSVPAADFDRIVHLGLSGMPAVVASRRLVPDGVSVPESTVRRAIGFAWHLLVKVLLGVRLEDAQCGLKIFSKRVVREIILKKLTVTNRAFEVGMMFRVSKEGVPILEVPVAYVHDFDSRMPIGKALPVMLLTLVGISLSRMWTSRNRPPPKFVADLNRRFAAT